jgi:SAM-dependent methyltransferase
VVRRRREFLELTVSSQYDSAILSHYAGVARSHGLSETSTMEDRKIRELETDLIVRFVSLASQALGKKDAVIADIGCGNGFTLQTLRSAFPGTKLVGRDFSPDMAALAAERFKNDALTSVDVGDIRQPIGAGKFDVVISQRVIINLLSEDDQRAALSNIVQSVSPGGMLLFIEAFESGLRQLNEARAEFDLDAVPPAHHNLLLQDSFFDGFDGIERFRHDDLLENFLSTHFFVARVLHPIALNGRPFQRNSHFVRQLSESLRPGVGNYSPLRAIAFRRL